MPRFFHSKPASSGSERSHGALWAHAAALGLVLLILVPIFSHGVALRDEGVYLAQADTLAEGSWWTARPFADLDPDGTRYALSHGHFDRDQAATYTRHALYPLIIAGPYRLAGLTGVLAVSAIAAWSAAVLTALLARELYPRLALAALWLAGIASPLLFDAFTVAGQAIAAAACAGLLLIVARARRGCPWHSFVLAAALTAVLVSVRSEGAIAAVAIAGSAGLLAVVDSRAHSHLRRDRLGLAVLVLGTAILVFFTDDWVAGMISGSAGSGSIGADRDPNALNSAWASLLRPWAEDQRSATVQSLLAVTAPALAALSWRLLPRLRTLSIGLLILGAVAVASMNMNPDVVTGLLPAFPLLAPGLIMLRRDDLRNDLVRLLSLVLVTSTGLLLATIYREGGALEWGGRFFHVLLPAAIPLVALGLANAWEQASRPQRVVASTAAVTLAVSLALVGLRWNFASRDAARELVDDTIAAAESFDPPPPVVVATLSPGDFGRIFWKQAVDAEEGQPGVLAAGNLGGLLDLLRDARNLEVDRILVVTDVGPDLWDALIGEHVEGEGWKKGQPQPRAGNLFLVELVASEAAYPRN